MQLLKCQPAWKMPGDVISGLRTPENIDTGEAYIKAGANAITPSLRQCWLVTLSFFNAARRLLISCPGCLNALLLIVFYLKR